MGRFESGKRGRATGENSTTELDEKGTSQSPAQRTDQRTDQRTEESTEKRSEGLNFSEKRCAAGLVDNRG
jgi:hypothetical protein